jgi:hypothetical protein
VFRAFPALPQQIGSWKTAIGDVARRFQDLLDLVDA